MAFLTRTILKVAGRHIERPSFGDIIPRLRDRANALGVFHGDGPMQIDYRGLGDRADRVQTVACDVRWETRSRVSSKRHVEGLTTSFRYPFFMHGVQPTYRMPPPATLYGHICSALGEWIDPQGVEFAIHAFATDFRTRLGSS